MENQFSKILKIKSQEVEVASIALERARSAHSSVKEALTDLESRANEVDVPLGGSVSMLQYNRLLKDSYREELLGYRYKLSLTQSEVERAKNILKYSQMEYEKFNHLHAQEVKKRLQRIKELEEKELDEIGSQRFYSQR